MSLCDILHSTFYWHTRPYHTAVATHMLSLSHHLQSVEDSASFWMDQAIAYWNWCLVCWCSQKPCLDSLQVSVAAILVQPVSAYFWDREVKNLCVEFSSHHMKKECCNCLPYLLNPCEGYNVPQCSVLSYFPVHCKISFLWWIMCYQVTLGSCLIIHLFQFHCPAS